MSNFQDGSTIFTLSFSSILSALPDIMASLPDFTMWFSANSVSNDPSLSSSAMSCFFMSLYAFVDFASIVD